MPIRSMTGFSQVKGQVNPQLGFTLSLKSVNHRFLDLHFRMPSDSDSLEMKLRRLLKDKLARGHVELTLSLERSAAECFSLNRELVGGYVQAFRKASAEFGLASRVISRSRLVGQSRLTRSINAAAVSGGISDGVPPPKKIETTSCSGASAR